MVDTEHNQVSTLVGGSDLFSEPCGLTLLSNTLVLICDTNNHSIKTLDLTTRNVVTTNINFTSWISKKQTSKKRLLKPDTSTVVKLKQQDLAVNQNLDLTVDLKLPPQYHLSKEAPSKWNIVIVDSTKYNTNYCNTNPS
jgi:hypothetical protein